MIKWVKITALVFALMLVATPLMAQENPNQSKHDSTSVAPLVPAW